MLITLTGGAGAGKTTLAVALAARVPTGRGAVVLHGDDYYVGDESRGVWTPDSQGVPRLDVGDPASVDWPRWEEGTAAALRFGAVVLVEGMFARSIAPERPEAGRYDVFVDLDADLRLVRKIERQCVRDGFPLEVLLRNYTTARRAAHLRHVARQRERCRLVVDGGEPAERNAALIWQAVSAMESQDFPG
jgi:uridine kinase